MRHRDPIAARRRVVTVPVGHELIQVCSQGERARVRIARALMADPALLLDEPFGGLDLPGREDLIDALHSLASPGRN